MSRVVSLSVCNEAVADTNITFAEPKWLLVSKTATAEAPLKTKVSANCTVAGGIRLQFSGTRSSNTSNSVGIRLLNVCCPNEAAIWTPTLTLLDELQEWLKQVSAQTVRSILRLLLIIELTLVTLAPDDRLVPITKRWPSHR